YQCSQMVVDWMKGKGLVDDGHEWLNAVASYHVYLFMNERKNLFQSITTHHALRRAGRHDTADLLALNYIVEPITLAGLYYMLLTEWLPHICKSDDLKTKGRALALMGVLSKNIGEYEMALS